MNEWEREEQQLEDDYAAGLISLSEFNRLVKELQDALAYELRSEAEEAAERAYNDVYGNW